VLLGWSVWATPRSKVGWEALLRWDHYTPVDSCTAAAAAPTVCASSVIANGIAVAPDTQVRERMIIGAAYWFPRKSDARVGSALMLDYDQYTFDNFDHTAGANPTQKRVALHALVNW
jgi:hypothetical protein